MLVRHVGLVSQASGNKISASELNQVAAALQRQVTRDFGPIWGIQATVSPFIHLQDVPLGYWPIMVRDVISQDNAAGFHTDRAGQPLALVRYSPDWSVTASHECLEMLADPSGNRTQAGDSVNPEETGRVEYLVEVCDPSEDGRFGYTVNGIAVSDFYTPHFFDPVQAAGVRYSYTGAITRPRQVLEGGYLSWYDPQTDAVWQQQKYDPTQPEFINLSAQGRQRARGESLREYVDQITDAARQKVVQNRADKAGFTGERVMQATAARARLVEEDVERLAR